MFPGNRVPVSRFSQVSQRLNSLAKQRYLPNVKDAAGNIPLVQNMLAPASNQAERDQHSYSIKGDRVLNDRHKLSGSYSASLRPRLSPNGLWDPSERDGGPLSMTLRQTIRSHYERFAYDWMISPRVLHHLTIYDNRFTNGMANVDDDIDGARELGIRNLTTLGYPTISWGGGPFVGLTQAGAASSGNNFFTGFTTWGLLDSVSLSKGRHFMKAGFDLRRLHVNRRDTQGGGFTFGARATAIPNEAFAANLTGYSFASYLLGIVDSASLGDPVGIGGRRFYYAAFFQDDFKVSSKLTLNLGLRWDYQPPQFEAADRYASWNPNKIDPASGLPGAYDFAGRCNVCTGKRHFGMRDFRDWGPRFGFALAVTPQWTIRGAYGIFYEGDNVNGSSPLTGGGSPASTGRYDLAADPIQPWKGIFNWDAGLPTDRYTPGSFDVSYGNKNNPGMINPEYGRSPYVQQWNFNLQREIGARFVLDIGYLGNKGAALRSSVLKRLNQLPASVLSEYGRTLNNSVRNPAEAAANRVPYPYAGYNGTVAGALRPYPQVRATSTVGVNNAPLGFSTYHALQVAVNRQLDRGLSVYANYVWSKNMANVQSSAQGGDNPGQPLDYYNLKLEKAVSAYDISHAMKAYLNYKLPSGRGSRGLNHALLGGWSVSCILNYFSGIPLGFGGSMPYSGGWNGAVNRANIAAGEMVAPGFDRSRFELSSLASASNTYLKKALFSDPAPLTLGGSAVRYAQARSFGTVNEDLGLLKRHQIGERYRFQIRAELLNVFNRHQFSGINTSVTSPLFGQVTGADGNRIVQVGARLEF